MSALAIDGLSVRHGDRPALENVSLTVAPGEIVALLGPSGAGKSTLAAAVMGLLPDSARASGTIRIGGRDTAGFSETDWRAVRGGQAAMIFQEPATALNPALSIGHQIAEVLALHGDVPRRERTTAVAALLARVGLDVSPRRYPHMLSGGQRQRVAIAMAIAAGPMLLLADEPTAALDPLARAEIAALLARLAREQGMGLLLITHDRALARTLADRTVTLAEGHIAAETAPVRPLPMRHAKQNQAPPLLEFERVSRTYAGRDGGVHALRDVSFTLRPGETLAVIGQSGSGKSTLARLALGLDRPDAGAVLLAGQSWAAARRPMLRTMRRRAQAVFQDPAASFDPRLTVRRIVAEPLHLLDAAADEEGKVAEALAQVGLPPDAADRLPQAFSGGQRQRIAIARALILRPDLVVLDEALSALDEASRDATAALLTRLQEELGLAYLFIAHDMALVRRSADRVLVLRDGRIVADGPIATVLDSPADPYVAALAASAE